MRFIDRKCFLESRLILLFYALGVASLSYILAYAVLAANFGAWSRAESMTYYLSLAFNVCFSSTIIWIIYYFHKHDKTSYKQRRFIVVNIILALITVLGSGCIYCYIYEPTKKEIQHYLNDRYSYFEKVQSIFSEMEIELKCCGISDYHDYLLSDSNVGHRDHPRLPPSCCIRMSENCTPHLHNLSHVYSHGCIKKSDLSDIKSSKVYKKLQMIKLWAIIPTLFPIITVVMIQIILFLVKSKINKMNTKLMRVNSWEDKPKEVHVVFRAPLSFQPVDQDGVGDSNIMGQNSSADFLPTSIDH